MSVEARQQLLQQREELRRVGGLAACETLNVISDRTASAARARVARELEAEAQLAGCKASPCQLSRWRQGWTWSDRDSEQRGASLAVKLGVLRGEVKVWQAVAAASKAEAVRAVAARAPKPGPGEVQQLNIAAGAGNVQADTVTDLHMAAGHAFRCAAEAGIQLPASKRAGGHYTRAAYDT